MVRLVGLWTKPKDVDGFRQEFYASHFPQLDRLENALDATVAPCIEGNYFLMTEVTFTSLADMEEALVTEFGKHVLDAAERLAEKFRVRIEILVIEAAR